ncbi:MAG: DUF5665 domain-containing protein [Solirubrobacterales bacterium]
MREEREREIVEMLHAVVDKVDEVGRVFEKMRLDQLIEMLQHPRRLLYINFLMGLARGFGMAIGFTILAGGVLWLLQRLAVLNVPVIGEFIAEIVRWVQVELQAGGPKLPGGM